MGLHNASLALHARLGLKPAYKLVLVSFANLVSDESMMGDPDWGTLMAEAECAQMRHLQRIMAYLQQPRWGGQPLITLVRRCRGKGSVYRLNIEALLYYSTVGKPVDKDGKTCGQNVHRVSKRLRSHLSYVTPESFKETPKLTRTRHKSGANQLSLNLARRSQESESESERGKRPRHHNPAKPVGGDAFSVMDFLTQFDIEKLQRLYPSDKPQRMAAVYSHEVQIGRLQRPTHPVAAFFGWCKKTQKPKQP
jgi:hypothetical protein